MDTPNGQPHAMQKRTSMNNLDELRHRHPMGLNALAAAVPTNARRFEKFIWELRRDGLSQAIRFSAPIYSSKKEAKTSGENVRTTYIIRNASKKSARQRPKAPHSASAR
jgi:hypothetical protein